VSTDRRGPNLLGRIVSPVIGAVDPDAVLSRVDVNDLIDRLDLDAVFDRVDVDGVIQRIDIDALIQRVDIDALVQRVDIDALVQRVDIDALVQRVDVDAFVQRIDIDGIVKRVRVRELIGGQASEISSRSLDSARRVVTRVDTAVLRPADKVMRHEAEATTTQPPLAGPISRLAAWGIDSFVISLSFGGAVAVTGYLVELLSKRTVDPTRADSLWWFAAGTAWAGLYLFLAWFLTQRTVGMAVLGIRLAKGAGTAVGARRAFVRVIVFPFSFVFGLGFIGLVFGRRRRALHDVAAGTVVLTDVALTPQAEVVTTF
jgi:uncharacterized RDD family membrane protein YckC